MGINRGRVTNFELGTGVRRQGCAHYADCLEVYAKGSSRDGRCPALCSRYQRVDTTQGLLLAEHYVRCADYDQSYQELAGRYDYDRERAYPPKRRLLCTE